MTSKKYIIPITIALLFVGGLLLVSGGQKEEIFFSEIENADAYSSVYINNNTKIDISDFQFDDDIKPYNSGIQIDEESIKQIKIDIYTEYQKHEFNNIYKHRREENKFQYAKYKYLGNIGDVNVEFYFNEDKKLSLIKLKKGNKHEVYCYYKGRLIFHRFWVKVDTTKFMANKSYRLDIQSSWILDGRIINRIDEFSLVSPEEIDNKDGSYDSILDSEGLISKANYYLQLYNFLVRKEKFHCRSRFAEYEMGRQGFEEWIDENIDNTNFTEFNLYMRNRQNDFEFQTLYEFEVDEVGNVNYLKIRNRTIEYKDDKHKEFAELIDAEIVSVLKTKNESGRKWKVGTHNCNAIPTIKYLTVKVGRMPHYLTKSFLTYKIMDERIESDESFFPLD